MQHNINIFAFISILSIEIFQRIWKIFGKQKNYLNLEKCKNVNTVYIFRHVIFFNIKYIFEKHDHY